MKKNVLFASAITSCALLSYHAHAAPIQQNTLSNSNASYTAANAQSQQPSQLWELRQSLEQLQNEVRQLRGQLEEKDNQLERLNQDVKSGYDDLDQRIELLNKKIDPDAQTDEEAEAATAAPEKPVAPAASASISNSSLSAAKQTEQATPTVNQSSNNTLPQLSDKEAYELAYRAYQQGGAAKAIQPMKDFVRQYPSSIYRSHALYWLGEFHLAINPPNFNAAKNYFKIVANQFPDSSKAPISLYRLGEISGNIDHNAAESKSYFQKLLQRYPNSAAASRAKTTYLR